MVSLSGVLLKASLFFTAAEAFRVLHQPNKNIPPYFLPRLAGGTRISSRASDTRLSTIDALTSRLFYKNTPQEEVQQTSEWYSPPQSSFQPANLNGNNLVTEIASRHEFDEYTQADQLVVVKFYAKWCKSCQKVGLLYNKLARKYSKNKPHEEQHGIRFTEVEYGRNAELCRELQIQQLPTVHFYVAGKLVRNVVTSYKTFDRQVSSTVQYIQMKKQSNDILDQGIDMSTSQNIQFEGASEPQPSTRTTSHPPPVNVQKAAKRQKWWEQFSKKP